MMSHVLSAQPVCTTSGLRQSSFRGQQIPKAQRPVQRSVRSVVLAKADPKAGNPEIGRKEDVRQATPPKDKEEKGPFKPPALDPSTPSPIFGGSTGGLLRKAQVQLLNILHLRVSIDWAASSALKSRSCR